MNLYLSADKDGQELKEILEAYLVEEDFQVIDLTESPAEDFVESANLIVQKLKKDEEGLGIAIDAYGAGSFMAANKYKGIVAAEVSDEWSAYMTRRHNNARIITLGSQIVGTELAKTTAKAFVTADYDGGRHQIRVDMLNAMC
ncbi:galactose-6-phosphate isomerase subunit LacA [Marinilactibacillus psychrotolerans]|uniref:Galactose-6-phosphate isomerase subunit LacA n=2 Tax=Marinilactibacillus psychrotolerans TaxID=191770 RepID=A0A5R9C0B4_9LACT|nr:galactose-6-phosphate isomerase subunit LacA [Marinilactibacillus psychrotolerans]TLQ06111.1 galactose-6-phosphate isomerase subunit LacA [Marinilactibacillus psychrotolerans]SJN22106.1 Galactose-6-phosphate isomerase, LacA subunit [Marinilactibacillus psychrotolerans 42ea]